MAHSRHSVLAHYHIAIPTEISFHSKTYVSKIVLLSPTHAHAHIQGEIPSKDSEDIGTGSRERGTEDKEGIWRLALPPWTDFQAPYREFMGKNESPLLQVFVGPRTSALLHLSQLFISLFGLQVLLGQDFS